MKKWLSGEVIIVVVSIVMYAAISSASLRVKSLGDLDFHREAMAIANCLTSTGSCAEVSLAKAPGPSVFYSLPYLFVPAGSPDASYWRAAVLWSGIWITVAMVLLYRAAIRFYGDRRAGALAIFLTMALPLHIYYGLGVMAEGPAFIAVILILNGWSWFETNIRRGIIFYATGITCLVLTRPNAGLVIPMVVLMAALLWWRKAGDVRQQKGWIQAALLAAVMLVALFMVARLMPGNARSSQEGYFLHVAQHGRFQFRDETWDWRFWDDKIRFDSKDYQHQVAVTYTLDSTVNAGGNYTAVYSHWVTNDVLDHPLMTVKQFLVRVLYGHTLTINSVSADNFKMGPLRGPVGYYLLIGGLNAFNWGMIMMAVYSLYLLRQKWTVTLFAVLPWLALVLFSAAIYMEQRYLFPARPVIVLLAAGGVIALWDRIRSRFHPDAKD